MDLKLPIYKDEFCQEIEREATAGEFKLSVGICEDVLNIINIDMFEGGLEALSDETTNALVMGIVKNGFPYFKKIIMRLFNLTEGEIRRTEIADIAKVVLGIVKYSIIQLSTTLGAKSSKN